MLYFFKIIMKKNLLIILFAGIAFLTMQCENPLKEEDKKERVITLVDSYFAESGRWIFYWDGRNKDGEYVELGDYIVFLDTRDISDQETITAIKGGKEDENNQARFEIGYWLSNDLEKPFPDPFRVKSGINIPVILSGEAHVKIIIYKQ